MQYNVEYTDTFGGEANYSWVKRHSFEAPDNASRKLLVRRAKSLLGLNGVRCRVEEWGEQIAIYPRGACVVAFINWHY